jgi:cyclopropane fatty-acyl-phospholipid synthase-like methyltransferase
MNLPFSEACERNKHPILEQLRLWLKAGDSLLEIGSGTGQHAVYFSQHLPAVIWQTSDLPERCAALAARIRQSHAEMSATPDGLPEPRPLTIGTDIIAQRYDVVFTANTTHIMPASLLGMLFQTVAEGLVEHGLFILYGPFKYNGRHTSDSNQQFDLSLRSQGFGGVPDVVQLNELASLAGLSLCQETPMPANNRLLVYRKYPVA